jgi:predicted ATP-dependent protease
VTTKIEGFFDLCASRGLDGSHGVVIPAQNIRGLMLKDEVVEAVKGGMFSIYAIESIDEGIELLTGKSASKVHGLVAKKLKEYYKKAAVELK